MTPFSILRVAGAFLTMSGVALAAPQEFASPLDAANAVAAAVEANDAKGVIAIFGEENRDLVLSGDDAADTETWRNFARGFRQRHRIDVLGDDRAVLFVGRDEMRFPAELAKVGDKWHFDAEGAREEVLAGRIGRNELDVIAALKRGREIQEAYRSVDYDGDGVMEFAPSILSSEGQRDGLYWPSVPGEPESPIGPYFARAAAKGYAVGDGVEGNDADPFHGYYFDILTRQGASAPGGAMDYMVNGNMVAGFALIAYPAAYGDSGIMTFIMSENGIVLEADLGDQTIDLAAAIDTFDPDDGWQAAE
jgi:Protein of unknown function (DUF2950)